MRDVREVVLLLATDSVDLPEVRTKTVTLPLLLSFH